MSKELEALWVKYRKTLEQLHNTLDELDKKPTTVKEYIEVPKIVEVEVIKDLSAEQRDAYEKRILELEQKLVPAEPDPIPNSDYWGRPKTSKKILTDEEYEAQSERRYKRLVAEVKNGSLDINTLSNAEQIIVKRLLDNE
tara:strand:+ start:52 stop:471 length:420 start_codon:yes stop_codon:yes gene_type:complete